MQGALLLTHDSHEIGFSFVSWILVNADNATYRDLDLKYFLNKRVLLEEISWNLCAEYDNSVAEITERHLRLLLTSHSNNPSFLSSPDGSISKGRRSTSPSTKSNFLVGLVALAIALLFPLPCLRAAAGCEEEEGCWSPCCVRCLLVDLSPGRSSRSPISKKCVQDDNMNHREEPTWD